MLAYLGAAALALALLARMAPTRTLEVAAPRPAPRRAVAATPVPPLGPVRRGPMPRGLMAWPASAPPPSDDPRPEPWTGAIFWDPVQPLAQVNGRLVGEGATVGGVVGGPHLAHGRAAGGRRCAGDGASALFLEWAGGGSYPQAFSITRRRSRRTARRSRRR
ncbi:MAG: hypothetical protein Q9Q13_01865 [Acidobacteriota bacterium]|nr:hypothetical protein [Acidobacteriota bacterium]